MTRTREITVYTFDELSPAAKERAADALRMFDNSDLMEEDAVDYADSLFEQKHITWTPENDKKFVAYDMRSRQYAAATGRFSKENSSSNMYIKVENERDYPKYTLYANGEEYDLSYVEENKDKRGFKGLWKFYEELKKINNTVLKGLEAQYEYEMSEEYVRELADANEYEFDERGRII